MTQQRKTTCSSRSVLLYMSGVLLLMLSIVLAGCDSTTIKYTSTATPVVGLPAFSDWRAAYLGQDGYLHAVTLDGKTDVRGALLPDLTSPDLGFLSAGISADGHMLAFNGDQGLSLIDVTRKRPNWNTIGDVSTASQFAIRWSPDGTRLATGDSRSGIYILDTTTHQARLIPNSTVPPGSTSGVIGAEGWLDATHLAVSIYQDGPFYTDPNGTKYPLAVGFGSLDITTGALHQIARIASPGLAHWQFSVSPDGKKALFSNMFLRDNPYTPTIAEIDTATGQVTQLPAIALATGGTLSGIAWRPDDAVVGASSGYGENGDLRDWTFNLAQDRATQLHLDEAAYVAGWSPDGRALVVTSDWQNVIGHGPYTISAITFDASGHPTVTLLTGQAMSFTFVGFVRTA